MPLRRQDSANREARNDDVLGRFIRMLAKAIVQRLQRDQRRGESSAGDKADCDSKTDR